MVIWSSPTFIKTKFKIITKFDVYIQIRPQIKAESCVLASDAKQMIEIEMH